MVNLKRFIKTDLNTNSNPLPLLNSFFSSTFSGLGNFEDKSKFKNFMGWARKSPQLIGFLNILVSDILSDDIHFVPLDDKNGRNRVQKSEKFFMGNKGREILEQDLYDMFITGQGYQWIGKLDKKLIKKELSKVLSSKELAFKENLIIDEISYSDEMIKKLRYIPSTTVTIKNNDHEIVEYIQRVGTNTKVFAADEIVHLKLIPLDGKPYAYPPMEGLLSEVYLLWLISQNYVSYFENGGHPDKVFVLPKEIAGSKNHSYLIETLKKYKKIQNKHGNLVFTGELKIEDLQKFENAMEHKELGLYLVGILAMFYGVPAGRIPFLIGKAANNGDAGGLADSGYWRKVSVWQSKIEEGMNRQLWMPYFKTKIEFARGYKQDEVRETQNEMQKTQVAEQRIRLGLWTPKTAGNYLGIDPEEVDAAQAEQKLKEEEMMKSGMLLQNNNSNSNSLDEPDKQNINARRSNTQNAKT